MTHTFNVNNTPRGYKKGDDVAGRVRDNNIYIGIVKQNNDAQRMGRLAVWIPEIGGDPNSEKSWFIVSYASPFAGVTPPGNLIQNSVVMDGSQQSYGFWMQPPDLDNQVLVCFVNGDTAKGFWFACIWQQNMNHMIPGIASATPTVATNACGAQPPTVEYNKRSDENPNSPKRPVFTPLADGISQQGLYHDAERGPSTTSVRREAPSKAYGWLTPRGNSVHVDDNPANEFIRMRTRSGAQIMVSETTGFVYINSKNGFSWLEVSDQGIDMYSRGPISLRAEGSLNLHADGSLNIEADGNLNLRAGGNLTIQSAHHTDIAGNGRLVLDFGGTASTKAGGSILLEAGGDIRQGAGGSISAASAGPNFRSASILHDDGGAPAPGAPSAIVEKPRALPEVNGEAPCYQQDTRQTITRRMPTHEPWTGHPAPGSNPSEQTVANLSVDEFASAKDAADVANSNLVPGSPAGNVAVNATDLDWLAACIIDEAGNQGDEGMAAVAQIIKNRTVTRMRSDGTVKGTVLSKDQFSGFYFSNVNGRYTRVCSTPQQAEQRGLQKIAAYQQNGAKWNKAKTIGQQVMAGTWDGPHGAVFNTLKADKRATMYLNLSATQSLSGGLPSWVVPSKVIGKIQAHTFLYA